MNRETRKGSWRRRRAVASSAWLAMGLWPTHGVLAALSRAKPVPAFAGNAHAGGPSAPVSSGPADGHEAPVHGPFRGLEGRKAERRRQDMRQVGEDRLAQGQRFGLARDERPEPRAGGSHEQKQVQRKWIPVSRPQLRQFQATDARNGDRLSFLPRPSCGRALFSLQRPDAKAGVTPVAAGFTCAPRNRTGAGPHAKAQRPPPIRLAASGGRTPGG